MARIYRFIEPLSSCFTCVFEKNLVHVRGGVLEQLVVAVEDDDGNLAVAQHAQLVRLEDRVFYRTAEKKWAQPNRYNMPN